MRTPTTGRTARVMEMGWALDFRAELDALGRRRAQRESDDAALTADIRRVLRECEGEISRTEAADRLGIHRTTLYRVYLDET